MTDITNFDRIRVGGRWPLALDVAPIEMHETDGIYAQFHVLSTGEARRIELRFRDGVYALFLFGYEEQALPEWWKGSALVWSLAEGEEQER